MQRGALFAKNPKEYTVDCQVWNLLSFFFVFFYSLFFFLCEIFEQCLDNIFAVFHFVYLLFLRREYINVFICTEPRLGGILSKRSHRGLLLLDELGLTFILL